MKKEKKKYPTSAKDVIEESIWVVENGRGYYKPLRELKTFIQQNADIKQIKESFEAMDLLGRSMLKKLNIKPEKTLRQNTYKLMENSHIVGKDKHKTGLKLVGEYIDSTMQVDAVIDEIPEDLKPYLEANCLKYKNGKLEIDEDKYNEFMGAI